MSESRIEIPFTTHNLYQGPVDVDLYVNGMLIHAQHAVAAHERRTTGIQHGKVRGHDIVALVDLVGGPTYRVPGVLRASVRPGDRICLEVGNMASNSHLYLRHISDPC